MAMTSSINQINYKLFFLTFLRNLKFSTDYVTLGEADSLLTSGPVLFGNGNYSLIWNGYNMFYHNL